MPILNPTPLDMRSVDLLQHNIIRRGNTMRSRPGLVSALTPSFGRSIVGTSKHTSNSGVGYWYLLEIDTTNNLYVKIYNTDLVQLGTTVDLQITLLDRSQPLYWSQTAYNKIYISGYGLPGPLIAEVGSTPRRAQASEPIVGVTPLTPAKGPSTRFGDRIAVAENNICYINYPGTDAETFAASGVFAVSGTITNLLQSVTGDLRVITGQNQTIADQAGLVEEAFDGRTVSNGQYQSSRPNTAATSPLGDYGLYRQGVINLQNLSYTPLTQPGLTHQDTPATKHIETDYRDIGRIWGWSRGLVVSIGINQICVIDLTEGSFSWWDDTAITADLLNVIEVEDNQLIFVFSDKILATYDDSPDCNCALTVRLPQDPFTQNTVSAIAVATLADGVQTVKTRVRDSVRTVTPGPVPSASLVGTAVWDTAIAKNLEINVAEANHDKRGNNLTAEIIIGRNTELIGALIDDKVDQGKSRRRQV